jgi:hypothetical protein
LPILVSDSTFWYPLKPTWKELVEQCTGWLLDSTWEWVIACFFGAWMLEDMTNKIGSCNLSDSLQNGLERPRRTQWAPNNSQAFRMTSLLGILNFPLHFDNSFLGRKLKPLRVSFHRNPAHTCFTSHVTVRMSVPMSRSDREPRQMTCQGVHWDSSICYLRALNLLNDDHFSRHATHWRHSLDQNWCQIIFVIDSGISHLIFSQSPIAS